VYGVAYRPSAQNASRGHLKGRVGRPLASGMLAVLLLFASSAGWSDSVQTQPAPSPVAAPTSSESSLFYERTPAISANPGASNSLPGTGWLGRLVGFTPESGVRVGGAWVGNSDYLFTGGEKPGTWSFNSLMVLNLNLNLERIVGLSGGSINATMLQYNGEAANNKAGSVQGYDGLIASPPLVRTELYELWYRQKLFHDKLIVRVGKSITTAEFNNVSRPVEVSDASLLIPAVTSLIYTPIFVNPTLIGVAPGYYNSAYGVSVNWAPNKSFYLDVGVYDGAGASGVQTGLKEAPVFNGHYFMIGEAAYCWLLGAEERPGKIGVGGWVQTGEMYGPEEFQPGGFKPTYQVQEEGAQGAYTYGSQRLWLRHPGVDNTGVSAFYQFGFNQSNTMPINRYFGLGATGFGLLPGRTSDSMGAGLAWSWLNRRYGFRGNEAMLQAYYQAHLIGSLFLQPVVSYIPNPGASPQVQGTVAGTMQVIVLF